MRHHSSVGKSLNTQVEPQVHRYLYHFAMEYWDRGWPVIPLHGKRPALPGWKEYQTQRPTVGQVGEWFADPKSDLNIGVVLGAVSGIVVVDCDSTTDAQWWLNDHPASPLMVETSRGLHIYYRMPNTQLGNRAKLFGRAIDLKAEASYVCAPPSRHNSGKVYSWMTPNCLAALNIDNVPQFDAEWLGAETIHAPRRSDLPDAGIITPRRGRMERRIQGLIRYLDRNEHEPDRSARDFGVCIALLRLGCSPAEVAALVCDHSKFRHNQNYLVVTIENALKAYRDEID